MEEILLTTMGCIFETLNKQRDFLDLHLNFNWLAGNFWTINSMPAFRTC